MQMDLNDYPSARCWGLSPTLGWKPPGPARRPGTPSAEFTPARPYQLPDGHPSHTREQGPRRAGPPSGVEAAFLASVMDRFLPLLCWSSPDPSALG